MQGRTSLVIAQRISTVLNADKIIVLDKGRIAAVGNHEELMENSAIYAEIYHSQLAEDVVLENNDAWLSPDGARLTGVFTCPAIVKPTCEIQNRGDSYV